MSDNHFTPRTMRRKGGKVVLFALAFAGIGLLMGAAVMWLWNNILPGVTGVGTLTYWQAVGLLVLCRLLFGGFRGRPGGKRRANMRKGWMHMSDEERARFRAEWQDRCRDRKN
jgi:hypothetical protein